MITTTTKRMINTLAAACCVVLAAVALLSSPAYAQDDGPVFELRTYKSTPGNLDALMTRFRDHTMRLFEKHGMTNIGYWQPTDPALAEDTLIYLLRHESQDAANASWRAFGSDPEWQRVNEESNSNGAILLSVQRQYMTATDFSQMK